MTKALELSWVAKLKQWRKRRTINGKEKTFYLGKGEGKNDRVSYGRALAKWREIERVLNHAQRGEDLRRAYDEWREELVNRPESDLDLYFPRSVEPIDPTKPLAPSMQRWMDGEARMGEDRWWKYNRSRPELYTTIAPFSQVLVCSQVSAHHQFAFLPAGILYANYVIIFAFSDWSAFTCLQSRAHETWVRFLASSMKDDIRYTPSDCFETFPFPDGFETDARLEAPGKAYYEFRAALMVRNNEGLTKTYNRFHDPEERSPDILKLRELHAAMDRAVLDAYGWTDIDTKCEFLLDYEEDEDDEAASPTLTGKARKKRKPYRHRWPDAARDEVLARLLALNAKRAEEEKLAGTTAGKGAVGGKRSGKTKVKKSNAGAALFKDGE